MSYVVVDDLGLGFAAVASRTPETYPLSSQRSLVTMPESCSIWFLTDSFDPALIRVLTRILTPPLYRSSIVAAVEHDVWVSSSHITSTRVTKRGSCLIPLVVHAFLICKKSWLLSRPFHMFSPAGPRLCAWRRKVKKASLDKRMPKP